MQDLSSLVAVGALLKEEGYSFITPTPETHRRVFARGRRGSSLVDLFGWSRIFHHSQIPRSVRLLLEEASALEAVEDGYVRSKVRFSTLGPLILMHSAYPTDGTDAVFFGPDTYRFAVAIRALFARHPNFCPRSVVDVGAGTGAGGLLCGVLQPKADILLADINPVALRFADVNSRINAVPASTRQSSLLAGVGQEMDFVICNPPYLVDPQARTYRNGGGDWGFDLALNLLSEAVPPLGESAKLLLYTGVPVVDGVDLFKQRALSLMATLKRDCRYEEVDPDVFGEELERGPYVQADRIGVVVLSIE